MDRIGDAGEQRTCRSRKRPTHDTPVVEGKNFPTVPDAGGRLKPELIQAVVRKHYEALRSCYAAGLGRNPALRGRVLTAFVIDRDGSVSGVHDGGSELNDAVALQCMRDVFEEICFPPPEQGTVTVVYPIMFEPGD
jgi:hypothetical protein